MSSHSMKHKNEPGGNEQQQQQQQKEGDDVVDLCSEDFDPLKALTSQSSTLVPVPGAPTFDNLSQFLASVRSRQPGQQRRDDLEAGPSSGRGRGRPPEPFQRRFLPHQGPVAGRGRDRVLHNVLTRMEECTRGPMAVLRNCMANKTRVKVWIRGAAWIRGFCTGYVAAFDKQWNLALTDVDETFTQKRRRKTPLLGPVEEMTGRMASMIVDADAGRRSESDADVEDDDRDIAPPGDEPEPDAQPDRQPDAGRRISTNPKPASALSASASSTGAATRVLNSLTGVVVVRRDGRSGRLCQRHVGQLFVRGEQVALIAVLDV